MDFVSHYLIGNIIAVTRKKITRKQVIIVSFFGLLPDVTQIPLYLYVGYINHRPYWFPENIDWSDFRGNNPLASSLWDIPHSLFFLFFIWLIVKYFRLHSLCFVAYFSHILIDIPTHTGEWAVKFLYPFPFIINGFSDVWAWKYYLYPVVWVVLIFAVLMLTKIVRRSIKE